jgi:type VI secretion system secreted protein VgrG
MGGQNRKYLITSIEHRAGSDSEDSSAAEFRSTFEAVPFDVQYRPERRTPWPSIAGVVHAHVDSGSSGKFSTLDSQSRYRIRFPFDSAGKKGEQSSTWVRLAQSYAGSGYGSHYPLHMGTEVLVAFYDGDPDRPVIVGAVPNAVTPAASAGSNASQSTIRSASGIHIAMDDEL